MTKFIISPHGDPAEIQDGQTFTKGGFAKTVEGLRNVAACGVHIRTNTVINRRNLDRLAKIAEFACELGVSHLNFSNMHPVGSARFSRSRDMMPFSMIRRHLYPALEVARDKGRRVILEGFPHCSIQGWASDMHLTNEHRDIKMLVHGNVLSNYDEFMKHDMSVFGRPCQECAWKDSVCTGVYPEYIEFCGWDEFGPEAAPAFTGAVESEPRLVSLQI